jgi:hypothetical protein
MSRLIIRALNPWKYRREQLAARIAALRARDGDACARCRRPLRFDLPAGHDAGAILEPLVPGTPTTTAELDELRLCHGRCNPAGVDHTEAVLHRARLKNEAALFAKSRQKRVA